MLQSGLHRTSKRVLSILPFLISYLISQAISRESRGSDCSEYEDGRLLGYCVL